MVGCPNWQVPYRTQGVIVFPFPSREMLVEPSNCLQEGLLLGKFLYLDRRVATNGEAVFNL